MDRGASATARRIGSIIENPSRRNRLLEAVFDNATVSFFVMDEKQRCIYMNGAAEEMTGYRLDELQGQPLHDIIHHTRPDGSPYPLEECPIDFAFPNNNRMRGEEIFVRPDGTFYPVAYSASPIHEGDDIVGTILEVMEISDRKRSEAALRETAESLATINRVGTALAGELDLERLVQAVTDACTELSGAQFGAFFYNRLDENGESYSLYTLSGVPRETFANFPMPRNTHVFGPTFRGEAVVRSDDITRDPRYGRNPPYRGMPEGHLPVRSYLAVPVVSRSGEVLGGLFLGHPEVGVFSERVEATMAALASQAAVALDNARLYEEAQRLNGSLEQKVEQRTAELRALTEELQAFNYSVSHDLRAPLRGIDGFSQVLLEDFGEKLEDEARRALDRIRASASRMGDLIDDLLELSRLTSADMRPQLVDVKEIVAEVAASLREREPEREVEVSVEEGLTCYCDPSLIRIVMENLLGNCWKFTRESDLARIEVSRLSRDGKPVVVVSDNGVGFEMEYADRIFRPFQRLHRPDEFEGSGVGLAIVQRIVQRHGGRIWAEGEPGRGASFFLSLPDGPGDAAVPPPAS